MYADMPTDYYCIFTLNQCAFVLPVQKGIWKLGIEKIPDRFLEEHQDPYSYFHKKQRTEMLHQ